MKQLIGGLAERVGEMPLSDEDWENLRPIREKIAKGLEVKGIAENYWKSL